MLVCLQPLSQYKKKELYRGFLDKYQLKELANMLCEHANCKEKISKMHSYINEM